MEVASTFTVLGPLLSQLATVEVKLLHGLTMEVERGLAARGVGRRGGQYDKECAARRGVLHDKEFPRLAREPFFYFHRLP